MNVEIKCKKCGRCCKGECGPFVFPSDVSSIANHLRLHCNTFLRDYCELHTFQILGEEVSVYSINISSEKCVFLGDNCLCKIYPVRPYQCIHAPFEFFSDYQFWSHMPCVSEMDFRNFDSRGNDVKMLQQLIDIGYSNFEEGDE